MEIVKVAGVRAHSTCCMRGWSELAVTDDNLRMAVGVDPVPVLVLSGVPGSGKTTIGRFVAMRLREAGISHAMVDHEWIAYSWPVPPDDEWNERVAAENLACVWSNFQAAGAGRLIFCRVVEARGALRHVMRAVPGAAPIVVHLRAPLELIEQRLIAREPEPRWHLEVAAHLADRMDRSRIADFVVDNDGRRPEDIAGEVLDLVRWLG